MVVRFYGMHLLSAKCPRSPGRREHTLWKAIRRPLKGPILPFGAMDECYPISVRDQARLHQFGKEVLPRNFVGCALIVRRNLERRHSDCWYWRIGKVGCIGNISQKTECKRSPDNPKRRRICISCGRWFSKIISERRRIPRIHTETGTHRKDREPQRRISRR